jgi:hypothetical protein
MQWTVILNTCNRARFLPLVLAAWRRVRANGLALVIADDGSEDGTDEVLRRLAPGLPFPVTHVWHPRRGHRRAEILNKAVHRAATEALLFTDADSLPAAGLLAAHAAAFDGKRLLCGGYLRLSPEFTATVTEATAAAGDYERELTPARLRALRWQQVKNAFYVAIRKKGRPHNMGLNMALPRSAYVAINGYDNEFRGWGRADGDLRERLRAAGVRPFSVWDQAIVFHLHHPPDATKALKANEAYSERREIPVRCPSGFDQVAPEVVFSTGS